MNKTSFTYFYHFRYFQLMLSSACIYSRQVNEQIAANYKVLKKTYPWSDKEQDLDIYIPRRKRNWVIKIFTVIFSYIGGYYLSDKSRRKNTFNLTR
jgi:Ni,Fe-hydrogenase I cytochrome b subunit